MFTRVVEINAKSGKASELAKTIQEKVLPISPIGAPHEHGSQTALPQSFDSKMVPPRLAGVARHRLVQNARSRSNSLTASLHPECKQTFAVHAPISVHAQTQPHFHINRWASGPSVTHWGILSSHGPVAHP